MDRRNFIGAGVASGVVAAAGSACSPALRLSRAGPARLPDMDAYLRRVDDGMARIGQWSPTARFPTWNGDRAAADALGRTSLQTLYLTGMFGDLPIEGQLHPGMQDRMWAAQPLMDEATDRMTSFLTSRNEADLALVQQALRESNAGLVITSVLDQEALLTGVSESRRRQTSMLLAHAGWRLRNQPPSLMIGEYLHKIERVSATDVASEARQQWLAARVGEGVFWQAAAQQSKKKDTIGRGARTMGIGLLIFAGGAAIATAGREGTLLGVGLGIGTVGAIWFLVGLMIFLVGLAGG